MSQPAGISEAAVSRWLEASIDGVRAPFRFDPIAGGRSNLTYVVTDASGRRMVLRRPPVSHVLPAAHDMAREHRIISALHPTAVPVPVALAFCADESVTGRPFYVMEFVDGYVLRDAAQAEAVLDTAARHVAGLDLVDVLASLHEVDIEAVGLASLARHENYIARQLHRWHGQFERSQQQAREAGVYRPVPLVDRVHALLAERIPAQLGTAIVHGDYRVDNTVISADGRVRAVLDWELCTLGDALADVGTMIAYWGRPGEPPVAGTGLQAATALPGFPTPAQVADRYASRSGRDLTDIGYYVAFALWKLACISEGVYVRYAANAMGSDTVDMDVFRSASADRAQRALEILRP